MFSRTQIIPSRLIELILDGLNFHLQKQPKTLDCEAEGNREPLKEVPLNTVTRNGTSFQMTLKENLLMATYSWTSIGAPTSLPTGKYWGKPINFPLSRGAMNIPKLPAKPHAF